MVHENRRRYVVFHVTSPPDAGKGLIIKMTREITKNLSEEEYGRLKPWFVYYRNQWGIVRTGHRGCGRMIEILESLDGRKLRDCMFGIRVVGVSGTIRSAYYKHVPEMARSDRGYRKRD
jgi:RNase P/RNase MRP subunit POP5